jgi:hypothetical protein
MARLKKYASVKPEDGSSRLNANEEKKVAWMPLPGQKKEKKKEKFKDKGDGSVAPRQDGESLSDYKRRRYKALQDAMN